MMAKRKKKVDFELVPLPPDIYEKPMIWSRDPVVVECANPMCDDICDEERVLCETHFYGLLVQVKTKAALNPKIREALP